MFRQNIVDFIKKAIKQAQKKGDLPEFEVPDILVERPENERYGDYATNIAMQVAKIVKEEPMEIAKLIISNFQFPISNFFERIEVKGPGFINFFVSKEFLQRQVWEILKQWEKFGELKDGGNKKVHPVKCRFAAISPKAKLFNRVNIEFISGNPTGPLHIGHGRGAFFGDCLANVLKKAGYKVVREFYINDARNSNQVKELGKTALRRGTVYLNEYLESKIENYESKIKKFKNEGDAGYFLAQIIQKENKDFIEKELKIKFDNWISEEDLYKKSKIGKIYKWLKKKNLIYKKEGAEWLKTTEFGDKQDWVLIRATGEPTYLLSDIAYHKDKFDRKFSRIINIWGADHQGHVSKVKAVAKMLSYKGDLDILITQVVRLKGGLKLSKRKGQIITLKELINEVGLDVARFFYLTKSLNTQMEFDLDLAKEQSEKNPVYYIQYAYARIHSILAKLKNQSANRQLAEVAKSKTTRFAGATARRATQNLKLLNHPSELNLIKQLLRFPEVIGDTSRDYQAQRIPQYAMGLAAVFHQFYRDCRVLRSPGGAKEDRAGEELSNARLALVFATKIVLKNTLDLMGISAPEKM